MIDNFDFKKAKQFIEKTKQSPYILKGVTNSNPINEMNIINNIDNYNPDMFLFHTYYDQEQLYCKLLKDNDYCLTFSLEELNVAFNLLATRLNRSIKNKKYVKILKSRKPFNKDAYKFVKEFNNRYSY